MEGSLNHPGGRLTPVAVSGSTQPCWIPPFRSDPATLDSTIVRDLTILGTAIIAGASSVSRFPTILESSLILFYTGRLAAYRLCLILLTSIFA